MSKKCAFKMLLALALAVLLLVAGFYSIYALKSWHFQGALGPQAPQLRSEAEVFRDLNKNGRIDVYEDHRLDTRSRVEDLLSQMTLEEKAGLMFMTMIAVGPEGELMERPSTADFFSLVTPINSELIAGKLMNSFNIVATPAPEALATWHNKVQKLAERTRLGIPITIASDPRHAFGFNPAASLPAEHFSLWPEPLGLAATRDMTLVGNFASIAREEYRAVGIRLALHPMADLATEPRWARAAGTFGEDAALAARIVYAYVKGFQGDNLGPHSVATMVKHFSGGGPQKDGEDAHFAYGKEQAYPGNNFDYHLIPFVQGAFPAGVAQIMPYYGIPLGQTDEDIGFAFNETIIEGMLRERFAFNGVICSDWGLISDSQILGLFPLLQARAWGVEALSPRQRMLKMLDAGIDQFGGEHVPELLLELVASGEVTEARLNQSVRRILHDKFALGLFDQPYVDAALADSIVSRATNRDAGERAQRKSLVLLKNAIVDGRRVLPIKASPKIYVRNIDRALAADYAELVDDIAEADLALIRIAAPYEARQGLFERFFHAGDLDFKGQALDEIMQLVGSVPTVVDIYLDRAAVIPEIAAGSIALIANFGVTDKVLLDLVFGRFAPTGKLPIELPKSMAAVRAQLEDVPYDSLAPLYEYGHGLTYDGVRPPREAWH